MKKLALFLFISASVNSRGSAQAIPPAEMVKCVATKDVKSFVGYVKGIWLTPWGHKDWQPSGAVRKGYNNVTGNSDPCEYISAYDKTTNGRYIAVTNFEDKMVQVGYSSIEKPEVDSIRNYLKENGFTKGHTTSWETWESKDVIAEVPNPWETSYLKVTMYVNTKK
jgi:hypothetical protein